MLINIGRNVKKIQTGTIENTLCPNCNFKNGLKFSIYGGFVNVIVIPTAPIKRTIIVECDNCKKTYKLKELPSEIKNNFKKQYKKNPVKTPIWQFLGSFILAGLMSLAIYTGIQAKKAEKIYIQNPLTGDTYRLNNEGH
jgi:plasmid rolling circle replication initiator protein Rep